MRLNNFDLNLLVAFDILLQEQNVTKAADRANVTQSAMSASLKRLREAFHDEILAQQGRKMVPTPFALSMQSEISAKIGELRGLISRKGIFDPLSSDRQFKITASDYITTVLLVPLLNSFAENAPGITFDISLPNAETSKQLANGEVDFILTPDSFVHEKHPFELVFEERHVVVGWSGNPVMSKKMSKKRLAELGHVGVLITGKDTFQNVWMQESGVNRRIEIIAPSFLQAPFFIPGTMRIAIMHERLAKYMAKRLPLKILKLPLQMPPMREVLQYHSTREMDPGLTWLREQLRELALKI